MLKPYGTFLGVEVFAERRWYSRSCTYTWLYAKHGDSYIVLGDPWPCIMPKRSEVETAIQTFVLNAPVLAIPA